MHWNNAIYWILISIICTVFAHRDLFETKCKRTCNTLEGSLDCWTKTTDGFAYGLSTTMIDFCQTILKIRNLASGSWYNISRNILAKRIEQYELESDVQQLTKANIEQIAVSLLDRCFNAASNIISLEPSCPLCSESQTTQIKQWRFSSIILIAIGLGLILLILLLYSIQTYHIRRLYMPIN